MSTCTGHWYRGGAEPEHIDLRVAAPRRHEQWPRWMIRELLAWFPGEAVRPESSWPKQEEVSHEPR